MNRADYLLGCVLLGSVSLLGAGGVVEAPAASGPPPLLLPSAIPDVSDEAWTRYVDEARKERQPDGTLTPRAPGVVSGNGLGMFEIRLRRLADLGLVEVPVIQVRDPETGRMVWVTEFVAPYSAQWFLMDPELQLTTFAQSMLAYVEAIRSEAIDVPDDPSMTLSGQIAVLHRAGPSGLQTWASGARFGRTVDFYQRANGIF